MSTPPSLKFNVYGRYVLVVERDGENWRVLQAGDDGKRRLRDDIVIPSDLSPEGIAQHLDDLLHELAGPGARVERVS